MTKRTVFLGLAVIVGGGIASHFLGSRPETPRRDGPLRPCPDVPNCAMVRVPLAADAQRVETAVQASLRGELPWWTGRLISVEAAGGRTNADFSVGPFTDRLALAVEPEGEGSILWIRSASVTGRSDLGVNRARVQRLVEAVRAELG